jgi:hypothetical protein
MGATIRVLMVGDVVGQAGMRAAFSGLRGLAERLKADVVIANGENASNGVGMTVEDAETLFSLGIDAITSGNHIWEKKDYADMLERFPAALRPANYPKAGLDGKQVPGKGVYSFQKGQVKIGVVNVQGREDMYPIDCPFKSAQEACKKLRHEGAIAIVDFHAESVEEKEALALYVDGIASVVAGTHTHVQTADERILPGGTGYISDLGMTGAEDSVIGFDPAICVRRGMTQMPLKMEGADTPGRIHGALFEIDVETKRCVAVERVVGPVSPA